MRTLKILLFALLIRPLIYIILGLNVRGLERLPTAGPAIIAANHNSHLDTFVLMALLPLRLLPRVRPVAAADYFLGSGLVSWLSTKLIGIIPIERAKRMPGTNPLDRPSEHLSAGDVLIIFPEGTRGEPEALAPFKNGIAYLAERHPNVPIVPVFLHGLGKSLPKNERIPVPFFCDVFVGEPLHGSDDRRIFMEKLEASIKALPAGAHIPNWE
jgi:1-acyl-sn-glycerol-3-phosphate acyltransferase